MAEQENVQLIQELYAAFGRGDVPAIVDRVTDDVEGWQIYEDTARELGAHA